MTGYFGRMKYGSGSAFDLLFASLVFAVCQDSSVFQIL